MDFEARYKKLNAAQQTAVNTIDGPVMVIAGPGTGKTELLAMRAANILKQTDTLPENILCLTFTDAGSIAMKKRLTSIIGRDAYKVSVFTFHSFGTEIMNRYREYFYHGADFAPADDLARRKIITKILDSLPYNDPLRSKMNGKYTSMGDILSAFSDLKRASLSDGEFLKLIDAYQITIDVAGPLLAEVFAQTPTKQTKEKLEAIIPRISAIDEEIPSEGLTTLKEVLLTSLERALAESAEHPRTTPPLTEWRNKYMTHAADKSFILKAEREQPKLRSLCHSYGLYLQIMQEAELYDYDDMIMNLVHAMGQNDDLRYDLQEKYHYIMVDEFQDTNLAQMKILHHLTSNPVVEDTPNILVVGDDDQAIYGFQGAEVGNILNFRHQYPRTMNIALTENYRSVQPVLDGAREVITQGNARLENLLPDLDKTLVSRAEKATSDLEIINHESPHGERTHIAASIKQLLEKNIPANEIAIIARKHDDLISLISYLHEREIPISYERHDNVLDDEAVIQLDHLARVVCAIADGDYYEANAWLPEVLSHPLWKIDPMTVWDISLKAHHEKKHWIEIMRDTEATKDLTVWLVAVASQSQHLPLERMIDILIGNDSVSESYTSPFKDYFFSPDALTGDMSDYSAHLKNLSAIRKALRETTFESSQPKLADFLNFIEENHEADARITSIRRIGDDTTSVHLLSAHGSKGLEYNHVFIVNATDSMWGEKASGRASTISFPPHLRLRQNNNDYDERLRLFYVAMTRARHGLHVSYANENDNGKAMLPAAFLIGNPIPERTEESTASPETELQIAEHLWYAPIINIPRIAMQDFLNPMLKNYKLSATHINRFIDVTNGGPRQYLLETLLHFPTAPSPHANFGSAIHATLQRAHDHVRATGSLQPEEDILQEFERQMARMEFSDDERKDFLQKGSDTIHAFLKEKHADFSADQIAELDFSRQDVRVGDAHLTGKLDVAQFDKDSMTATVTDYKTGGVLLSWEKGQDYQKIKAHKYRQQLLFYKLLIEHSREWHNYTMTEGILQFVEPDRSGAIVDLRLHDFDPAEIERFTKLIGVIWRHINDLSFPDTSQYEPNYRGIVAFENDLLKDN